MKKEISNQYAKELIQELVKNDALRFIYDHKNKKLMDALND